MVVENQSNKGILAFIDFPTSLGILAGDGAYATGVFDLHGLHLDNSVPSSVPYQMQKNEQ